MAVPTRSGNVVGRKDCRIRMRLTFTLILLATCSTVSGATWQELEARAERAKAAGDLDGYVRWMAASGAAAAAELGDVNLMRQYGESAMRDAGVRPRSQSAPKPPTMTDKERKELDTYHAAHEKERRKKYRENKDGKYTVAETYPSMTDTMYKMTSSAHYYARDATEARIRDYEASKTPDELMHWFMLTTKEVRASKNFVQHLKDNPNDELTLEIKSLYTKVNGSVEKLREYLSPADARRAGIALERLPNGNE